MPARTTATAPATAALRRATHTALLALSLIAGLLLTMWPAPSASAPPTRDRLAPRSAIEAQSLALSRAHAAVVGLSVTAVDGARTSATLGDEREGSGVVITEDDLVLTIGYLVLEAQTVQITTEDGRRFPARVVAYDGATGFGLVQSLAPLGLGPVPLGQAGDIREGEALVLASGGAEGGVSPVQLLSRRAFSGYWEYHVDDALFTGPPRRDHAGAALFSPRGELLGIGSLLVTDAQGVGATGQPGNMFVPVHLLQPVLTELRQTGSSRASARPWLGLNCFADDGQVRVLRVSDDSPADVAGLQRGDHIRRIDGVAVADLAALWKTLWSSPATERAVILDITRDGQPMSLTVHAVDRAKTLRRVPGI